MLQDFTQEELDFINRKFLNKKFERKQEGIVAFNSSAIRKRIYEGGIIRYYATIYLDNGSSIEQDDSSLEIVIALIFSGLRSRIVDLKYSTESLERFLSENNQLKV